MADRESPLAVFRTSPMPRTRSLPNSLVELFNESSRPIYAIDGRRRIVYCNAALATWLELDSARITGRLVEYHSERDTDEAKADSPLTDLCPPPRALAGEACSGTISCAVRSGRLAHRQAQFVPLRAQQGPRHSQGYSILVLLGELDLTPHDLAAESASDPTSDELHRAIRRFRRAQAGSYGVQSLLGDSTAMQKVRAQVEAAAASGANALIVGQPGTGRAHVARAIHYRAAGEATIKLVPVDCALATEDTLRRALDALRSPHNDPRHRATLVLENLDRLPPSQQSQLLAAVRHASFRARLVATCSTSETQSSEHARLAVDAAPIGDGSPNTVDASASEVSSEPSLDPTLLDLISTITINVPRFAERMADLPIVAQSFLEACNRNSGKQIGSLRSDALDRLALYSWPGELDELQAVIAASHEACATHEITVADLPAVIHHASQAALRIRKQPERIVLDELLCRIEREAIERALAQANGNKTEAAELLGMTRPRLYRRLVQLGMVSESKSSDSSVPEFIETPPNDESL